jgi:hypothetical protein
MTVGGITPFFLDYATGGVSLTRCFAVFEGFSAAALYTSPASDPAFPPKSALLAAAPATIEVNDDRSHIGIRASHYDIRPSSTILHYYMTATDPYTYYVLGPPSTSLCQLSGGTQRPSTSPQESDLPGTTSPAPAPSTPAPCPRRARHSAPLTGLAT